MKVSERIIGIRAVLENSDMNTVDRGIIALSQLIQLEVEIVEALQIARQEGYTGGFDAGYTIGYRKGAYDAECNTETEV